MSGYHIVNARLVNEGSVTESSLTIADGRIAAIGGPVPDSAEVIDADGALLMPGMIDDQVHFREPGFEHKGTIATESRAAVAGGITSYMEMPNCNPLTISTAALNDKIARAERGSLANFAFYLGATNDNLEAIKSVDPSLPCGVKVFMGASTGNMLVDDETTLEGIFSSTPLVIATHCEDTPTILANEAAAADKWGDAVPFEEHPNIRSEAACYKSSSLAVSLARRHGSRLHVLHLTTAKELALFTAGDLRDKRITAEACVHHLFFDAGDYAELGAGIKCNPAIKTADDRNALLAAVRDDVIDVIATDHAPHTVEEKARPYPGAPAGLPLVQHALLTVLEHVHDGTLTLPHAIHKVTHAPAQLFDVAERGYLREGYWADLVLVRDDAPTVVDDEPVLSKCAWTPFRGRTFRSRIEKTWVNGHLVYRDGVIDDSTYGRALRFDRT